MSKTWIISDLGRWKDFKSYLLRRGYSPLSECSNVMVNNDSFSVGNGSITGDMFIVTEDNDTKEINLIFGGRDENGCKIVSEYLSTLDDKTRSTVKPV